MINPSKGFTLIELMIVVTIIAIIVAIAVPNMVRAKMNAHEASATAAMRTLSTAETAFQSAALLDANGDGIGDYGSLADLMNPGGGGGSPPFIDSVLGSGVKEGYKFTVTTTPGVAATPPAYTITANPLIYAQTGQKCFFVDESNVIRFTMDGTTATAASKPLN